jgi:hypothetical protein
MKLLSAKHIFGQLAVGLLAKHWQAGMWMKYQLQMQLSNQKLQPIQAGVAVLEEAHRTAHQQ